MRNPWLLYKSMALKCFLSHNEPKTKCAIIVSETGQVICVYKSMVLHDVQITCLNSIEID